jgi:hypothetical protein
LQEAARGCGGCDEDGGGSREDEGRGSESASIGERGCGEDMARGRVDDKALGEEEEGVQAMRGEEGVEGWGSDQAAERAVDDGDREELGEWEEDEDALLEVQREGVPRAGVGTGAGGGCRGHGLGMGMEMGLVVDRGFCSAVRLV